MNQRLAILRTSLIVVGYCLTSFVARAAEEPKVFKDLTFEAALKEARDQKKIVFIDFYTTWCGPCKMLDRTTWVDADVVSLLKEKTVPLKVDAEKDTSLAARYKVQAYPTLLLIKPDGTVLDALLGYRDAPTFISELKQSLAGKTSLIRAQERLALAEQGKATNGVQARYQLAQILAQQRNHDEALKEYMWLFDHGARQEPSFVGVRGSFLLSSIVALGRDFPPALQALRERRDAAKARFDATPSDRQALADFAAINRSLGENNLTLDVFNALPSTDPRRQTLAQDVFDQLVDARRYQEALAAKPIDQFTAALEKAVQRFWSNAIPNLNAEARKAMQSYHVKMAANQIETLAGANQLNEARKLIRRVRDLDDTESTRTLLRKHLERAGRKELIDF